MRTSATFLLLLLLATAAAAQEVEPQDYSRDTLMRIFAATEVRPEPEPPIRFHVGAVSFRALGSDWRINYLPIGMPYSGSIPRTTMEWPDPFSLTGTPIATGKGARNYRRAVNAELRRIGRTERARIKVERSQ